MLACLTRAATHPRDRQESVTVNSSMSVVSSFLSVPGARLRSCAPYLFLLLACLASGCSDNVQPPTAEQIAAFERAGAAQPSVDAELLREAQLRAGPYRVVPDDVLQFTMPALLHAVTTSEALSAQAQPRDERPYTCRISSRGTIALPAVGELKVAGLTLAEVEEKVVGAYAPFVVARPSVFVQVQQYKTYRASVIGAVAKPGVYMLRGDQMSVVSLLMEAGGIVEEGATVIRISRPRPVGTGSSPAPSPGLQSSAGQWSNPDVRLAVAHQQMNGPTGEPEGSQAVEVEFQHEGPLHTTGWLTLSEGGQVLSRKWLDIGNSPQRQAFLASLPAKFDPMTLSGLDMRLSRLAADQEFGSREGPSSSTPPSSGWSQAPDGRLVAYVPDDTNREHAGPAAPRKILSESTVATAQDTVTTLVLPVRGLNIPFRDVALTEGDTVIVERTQEPVFSVLGLVTRAGNFPYPANVQYTVAQAIAFAGGLDPVANPRYVTIYRFAPDGSVARLAMKLVEKDEFTEALNMKVKPGDVVAIEHTPRTHANTMIHDLLRINTGVYITGNDLWNRN
jgi:protein involved in polysaccharide export with SLBB domain